MSAAATITIAQPQLELVDSLDQMQSRFPNIQLTIRYGDLTIPPSTMSTSQHSVPSGASSCANSVTYTQWLPANVSPYGIVPGASDADHHLYNNPVQNGSVSGMRAAPHHCHNMPSPSTAQAYYHMQQQQHPHQHHHYPVVSQSHLDFQPYGNCRVPCNPANTRCVQWRSQKNKIM